MNFAQKSPRKLNGNSGDRTLLYLTGFITLNLSIIASGMILWKATQPPTPQPPVEPREPEPTQPENPVSQLLTQTELLSPPQKRSSSPQPSVTPRKPPQPASSPTAQNWSVALKALIQPTKPSIRQPATPAPVSPLPAPQRQPKKSHSPASAGLPVLTPDVSLPFGDDAPPVQPHLAQPNSDMAIATLSETPSKNPRPISVESFLETPLALNASVPTTQITAPEIAYYTQVNQKIAQTSQSDSWDGGPITVKITLNRNGELTEVQLIESSGIELSDQKALLAIQKSTPFGPVPDEIKADPIQINIVLKPSEPESASPGS